MLRLTPFETVIAGAGTMATTVADALMGPVAVLEAVAVFFVVPATAVRLSTHAYVRPTFRVAGTAGHVGRVGRPRVSLNVKPGGSVLPMFVTTICYQTVVPTIVLMLGTNGPTLSSDTPWVIARSWALSTLKLSLFARTLPRASTRLTWYSFPGLCCVVVPLERRIARPHHGRPELVAAHELAVIAVRERRPDALPQDRPVWSRDLHAVPAGASSSDLEGRRRACWRNG
jgi:hypothetical protein